MCTHTHTHHILILIKKLKINPKKVYPGIAAHTFNTNSEKADVNASLLSVSEVYIESSKSARVTLSVSLSPPS